MIILLSIYKAFSERILNGTKTIEIRKSMPGEVKYPIICLLYETKKERGSGKVVGYFTCNRIEKTNIFNCFERFNNDNETVRNQISNMSTVPMNNIFEYASNVQSIYLYFIDKYKRFDIPVSLKTYDIDYPPVSWRKVNVQKKYVLKIKDDVNLYCPHCGNVLDSEFNNMEQCSMCGLFSCLENCRYVDSKYIRKLKDNIK